MGGVLQNLPQGSRAAVLRLRSLGDCVLTTPALDILKQARPDLRIAVVVEERFSSVFEGNPDIDEVLPPKLNRLRRFNASLCLNVHGGTRSAWLTAASGARYRAGFGHFRHSYIYNIRIPRAQEILEEDRKVHTAEHLASAVFYLGANRRAIPRAKLHVEPRQRDTAAPYAVVHAVAATPEKTWPAERFIAVAEYLRQTSTEPIFIGAASDDLSPFAAFRTVKGAPLGEIKALLSAASLFVGNDSGPAHMAAAFGVPVVVLFGASDPSIWGPWRTASEILTAAGGISHVQRKQVLAAVEHLRVHA